MANVTTPVPNGTKLLVASNGAQELSEGVILVDASGNPLPSSQNAGQKVGTGFWKDINNSTTTVLAAGAVFTGAATDLIAAGVASLTYNLFAAPDQMATPPVLTFEFSPDGTNWDVQVPTTIANGNIFIPIPLRPVMQYFRIVYVNGSTLQTAFRLTTYLHSLVAEPLARTASQSLQPTDPMSVVRALVEPSLKGSLHVLGADRGIGGESIDASMVVVDVAQFDVPFANNSVGVVTSGGATATQTAANSAVLTSANAAGASQAQLQGPKKIRYSPGRETRMEFTVAFPAAGLASSDAVVGLTDTVTAPLTGNGIMVGYNGVTFGLHLSSGGAVTTVAKANWNGDLFDGSGLSEFRSNNIPQALDLTKLNAFRIRFTWAAGPVYLQIKSPDGVWVTAHTINYPNTVVVPYIQSPNLFMCWDVTKQGGASTGTLTMRAYAASAGTVEAPINFEPHEVHGQKQVQKTALSQTASTTVYTVSTGRQMLVKTINLSASASAAFGISVKDGSAGSIVWAGVVSVTGGNQHFDRDPTFPVPLIFTTGFYVSVDSGTPTFSIGFAAYEKEL